MFEEPSEQPAHMVYEFTAREWWPTGFAPAGTDEHCRDLNAVALSMAIETTTRGPEGTST
jgi:hypothetical protein